MPLAVVCGLLHEREVRAHPPKRGGCRGPIRCRSGSAVDPGTVSGRRAAL